jgi:hypothetical protein
MRSGYSVVNPRFSPAFRLSTVLLRYVIYFYVTHRD